MAITKYKNSQGNWIPIPSVTDSILGIDEYSEEEKVVGCWTDGKPIYRKTFKFDSITLPSGAWTTVTNVSNMNIERIVNGVVLSSQNGGAYAQVVCIQLDSAKNNLQLDDTWGFPIDIVTIEYTKTTDSPNSFRVSQITDSIKINGVGYEDYSTDEIVIGKWTNGKPIYRKCIIPDSLSDKTWSAISLSSLSTDTIIKIDGSIYWSNNLSFPINSSSEGGNTFSLFYVNDTVLNYYLSYGSNYPIANKSMIIVEYTKTTDAENSFSPDMVSAGMTVDDSVKQADINYVINVLKGVS